MVAKKSSAGLTVIIITAIGIYYFLFAELMIRTDPVTSREILNERVISDSPLLRVYTEPSQSGKLYIYFIVKSPDGYMRINRCCYDDAVIQYIDKGQPAHIKYVSALEKITFTSSRGRNFIRTSQRLIYKFFLHKGDGLNKEKEPTGLQAIYGAPRTTVY